VFGDDRPLSNVNHGAGIDVSPAVRDYLGLGSFGLIDWRFVEQADAPIGPWSLAVVSKIRRQYVREANLGRSNPLSAEY
jgi:hypothetical protein